MTFPHVEVIRTFFLAQWKYGLKDHGRRREKPCPSAQIFTAVGLKNDGQRVKKRRATEIHNDGQ